MWPHGHARERETMERQKPSLIQTVLRRPCFHAPKGSQTVFFSSIQKLQPYQLKKDNLKSAQRLLLRQKKPSQLTPFSLHVLPNQGMAGHSLRSSHENRVTPTMQVHHIFFIHRRRKWWRLQHLTLTESSTTWPRHASILLIWGFENEMLMFFS